MYTAVKRKLMYNLLGYYEFMKLKLFIFRQALQACKCRIKYTKAGHPVGGAALTRCRLNKGRGQPISYVPPS